MPRRTYTQEFKEAAAKLVTEQGYSPNKAAQSLGVDRASVTGGWPGSVSGPWSVGQRSGVRRRALLRAGGRGSGATEFGTPNPCVSAEA